MADRVYLSMWLRGFTAHNMLRHFEKALQQFPFSRLHPDATLRVYALEFSEPPMFEQRLAPGAEPPEVVAAARELAHDDCAYQLECFWDLWQFDNGWSLRPSAASLTCFAPLFPSEFGEQLLIDLGPDTLYVPGDELPSAGTPIRSNVRSLLRLVEEMGRALPVDKKVLWSESGENLAERLEEAVSGGAD